MAFWENENFGPILFSEKQLNQLFFIQINAKKPLFASYFSIAVIAVWVFAVGKRQCYPILATALPPAI